MDDFEKRLRAARMREIPWEWRAEILTHAKVASGDRARTEQSPESGWSVFSAVFWPSPKAWAGLAAVWALMFFINRGTADHGRLAQNAPPPSAELILAIQQQQRQLAELLHDTYAEAHSRPSPALKPRSESSKELRAGLEHAEA
jgi:hypothetical protein